MDIAAMSTIMSQEKVMQQASLSVMKMAMDTSKSQSVELTKMMEQSVNPHVGGNIDIKL
ncbi:YjfB family protein [Crassaminicella indica]|uniref:YjfB family protein n=2 Tax=Crassaminicella indica TaxID=2855394 RepID=A0ABX8R830_9CLOT|nr:YjfB family protein [Crassaminicella indica]QXM05183.1 YjfB family protein [Crassaminicella indica]